MKNQKLLIVVLIGLVFLYLLNFRMTACNCDGGSGSGSGSGEHWTVYGTNGCGWTRKQIDHMKSNGIPHTYIECDKKDCGEITSYPTLKNSSGKVMVGFNKI
jgi:hypothetical protein